VLVLLVNDLGGELALGGGVADVEDLPAGGSTLEKLPLPICSITSYCSLKSNCTAYFPTAGRQSCQKEPLGKKKQHCSLPLLRKSRYRLVFSASHCRYTF
jgi:hypothetical protein